MRKVGAEVYAGASFTYTVATAVVKLDSHLEVEMNVYGGGCKGLATTFATALG